MKMNREHTLKPYWYWWMTLLWNRAGINASSCCFLVTFRVFSVAGFFSGGWPLYGDSGTIQHHPFSGWWFFALPLWKMMDFVSWNDEIPNWMESHKIHVPVSTNEIINSSHIFSHWLTTTISYKSPKHVYELLSHIKALSMYTNHLRWPQENPVSPRGKKERPRRPSRENSPSHMKKIQVSRIIPSTNSESTTIHGSCEV